jgi:hypothetical protein
MLPDDWTTADRVVRFTCPICAVVKLAACVLAREAEVAMSVPTAIRTTTIPTIHVVRPRVFFIFLTSLMLNHPIH